MSTKIIDVDAELKERLNSLITNGVTDDDIDHLLYLVGQKKLLSKPANPERRSLEAILVHAQNARDIHGKLWHIPYSFLIPFLYHFSIINDEQYKMALDSFIHNKSWNHA